MRIDLKKKLIPIKDRYLSIKINLSSKYKIKKKKQKAAYLKDLEDIESLDDEA